MTKVTKLIALLFVFFITYSCISNKKIHTMYFDNSWNEVNSPKWATYYRLYQKSKDSLGRKVFTVKDYFNNGAIQMHGNFLNTMQNKSGLFTWYYENHNKKVEGNFTENKKQGIFKSWYDTGALRDEHSYINGKLNGKFKSFYENGIIEKEEGNFEEDLMQGMFTFWYEFGNMREQCNYNNGMLTGVYKKWYKTGALYVESNYSKGKLDSELKVYYENGNLKRNDNYSNDSLLNSKCYTKTGQDTAYYIFQKCARFHNGDLNTFRRFVLEKLVYPELAAKRRIEGRVFVQFSINSKGDIVDIAILKSPNDLLSKAAIEAISQSDKWEPAIQDGEKVKQQFTVPINFTLSK